VNRELSEFTLRNGGRRFESLDVAGRTLMRPKRLA